MSIRIVRLCVAASAVILAAAASGQGVPLWSQGGGWTGLVAVSRDGRMVYGKSTFWSASTGLPTRQNAGRSILYPGNRPVFSPDGKLLLDTPWDSGGNPILIDVATATTSAPKSGVSDPAWGTGVAKFSSDGRNVLQANGKKLQICDLSLRVLRKSPDLDPTATFSVIAASPQSDFVAMWGSDKFIRLVNPETMSVVRKLSTGTTTSEGVELSFTPSGKHLFGLDRSGRILKWSMGGSLTPAHVASVPNEGHTLAISPSGLLIAASGGSQINVFKLDGTPISQIQVTYETNLGPSNIAWGDTDASLWIADHEGLLECNPLDFTTKQILGIYGIPRGAAWSKDGTFIYVSSWQGIQKIDVRSGRQMGSFVSGKYGGMLGSPSRDKLMALTESGPYPPKVVAEVFSLFDGSSVKCTFGKSQNVYDVSFSANESNIAVATSDGYARIWAISGINAGKEITSFKGAGSYIYSIDFSKDGQFLATAEDTQLIVRSTAGLNILKTIANTNRPTIVRFSPDSKYMVYHDNTQLSIYRTSDWLLQFKYPAGTQTTQRFRAMAFTPDSKRVIVGDQQTDGVIYLNLETGATNTLKSGSFNVFPSPDGSLLLTNGLAIYQSPLAGVLGTVTPSATFAKGGEVIGMGITLASESPGMDVIFSSNSPTLSVPASSYIEPGYVYEEVPVFRVPITTPMCSTVTASFGTAVLDMPLFTYPAMLKSLTLSSGRGIAATSVTATITLDSPSLAGPTTLTLTSSSPYVTIPASIVVPKGAMTVSFPVTLSAPPGQLRVALTAKQSIRTLGGKVYNLSARARFLLLP